MAASSPEPQEQHQPAVQQQHSYSASSSPLPVQTPAKETDPEEENLGVQGLVAHRVAEYNARIRGMKQNFLLPQATRHRSFSFSGVRSQGMTPDSRAAPARRRTTSEGQYQNGHDGGGGPSPSGPVRSPIRCVSRVRQRHRPQPWGRPKEGPMHSYREAFEDMEAPSSPSPSGGEIHPPTPAFPVSPQTPYFNMCRSPPGLAKTPLSALGLKPHSPADILLHQGGPDVEPSPITDAEEEPRSYVESVARTAAAGGGGGGVPMMMHPAHQGYPDDSFVRQAAPPHAFNPPLSSSSPIYSPDGYPSPDVGVRMPVHMAAHPAGDPAFRSQPHDGMYQGPAPSYPSPSGVAGGYAGRTSGPTRRRTAPGQRAGRPCCPGSPHTLHRTVATNTPPSPALQRRMLNQAGHAPPANGGEHH
ncbi:hypothetical protein ANANG_G00279520 [Anguilla anguilla]|uniref:Uncharacterized protein n=1 Tax=Anguilla anguilla TaxID=7936 RepID=A0A9D3LNU5_ANGAN|nr:hypothetical protein ANANG_G00279520 [Anguilla anguilla]